MSIYVFYSVVLSFPEVANSKSLQNASKIIILIFERRCAWYTVVSEVFFAFSSTESTHGHYNREMFDGSTEPHCCPDGELRIRLQRRHATG